MYTNNNWHLKSVQGGTIIHSGDELNDGKLRWMVSVHENRWVVGNKEKETHATGENKLKVHENRK